MHEECRCWPMRRPGKPPLQNPRPLGCSMEPEKRISWRRAWRPQKVRKIPCNILIAFFSKPTCWKSISIWNSSLCVSQRMFRVRATKSFWDWSLQNKQRFELRSFRMQQAPCAQKQSWQELSEFLPTLFREWGFIHKVLADCLCALSYCIVLWYWFRQ